MDQLEAQRIHQKHEARHKGQITRKNNEIKKLKAELADLESKCLEASKHSVPDAPIPEVAALPKLERQILWANVIAIGDESYSREMLAAINAIAAGIK